MGNHIHRVASKTQRTGNGWQIPIYNGTGRTPHRVVHVQNTGKVTTLTGQPVNEFDESAAKDVMTYLGHTSVAAKMRDPLDPNAKRGS